MGDAPPMSRQEFQGVDMAGMHDAEVAMIERREFRLTKSLGHSQDGAVDEADLWSA
jgi:hypothetical protein